MDSSILFTLLSVVGVMSVFLLVAAVRGISLKTARRQTLAFLEDWAGIAPAAIQGTITTILGFAGGFVLVVALTYAFNQLGDATMPGISSAVGHFGKPLLTWSVKHQEDWRSFRDTIRNQWEKENPDESWGKLK